MHQLAGSRLLLNMRHEFSCKHDCQDEEAGTFAVLSKRSFIEVAVVREGTDVRAASTCRADSVSFA